ncbi:CHAP domain-containing protein [Streptococcus suis]|uniref:CHAP domain-containing protein n=1 Tax=Streptococcus suis TaxID=1307 RepID=UPI0021BBC5AD|nr:CHAP domain-containing protein [Streptococcus suis]
MTTANMVVDFFIGHANRGTGVDKDKMYGMQCVDVPSHAAKHWFGVDLWGNAIDLLDSAEQVGFEVHRMPTSARPRPGAFFVKDYVAGDGVNYGHTGVIISVDGDIAQTVEQNLAGNLYVGSPAQYASQRISQLVGWFYPPYEVEVEQPEEKKVEEQDMFTISAPGRGIALVAGGTFYALLDAKDPVAFWDKGVPHMQISQATFDNFQHKSNLDRLDDETVNKLIKGLK